MATFLTSAFWHGFNPTYFLSKLRLGCQHGVKCLTQARSAFVLGGFLQALGRKIRTNLRPLFLPADFMALSPNAQKDVESTIIKRAYDIASFFAVQLTLNFIVAPFLLLEIGPTMQAWKNVNFYGLFAIFVPFVLFEFVLPGPLRKMQLARAKAAGVDEKAITAQRRHAKRESDKGAHILPNMPQAVQRELRGHMSEMETDDETARASAAKRT